MSITRHPYTATKPKKPCGCGGRGAATSSKPSTSASATAKPCGCSGTAPAANPCACGCSPPTCFERPQFFPGQLLSDSDLSTEQKYFREKQKLYHRTLHGHGVVCGLRISCDAGCKGHIRIGDGFAIDECGNDIIVCEPYSFDAIGALKEKNWLVVPERRRNGCEEENCDVHQCFHVVICYDEILADFTTPFKTTCSAGAATCEATRVKETFRIVLTDCLPPVYDPLRELECKVDRCWAIFKKGRFAQHFSTSLEKLKTLVGEGSSDEAAKPDEATQRSTSEGYKTLFYELKALFLHQLQHCCDLYDCTLQERVCELRWCEGDSDKPNSCGGPIGELLKLVRQYVYECLLGEMIFSCAGPCDPSCVALGSIEVVNGRLVRVCNCPRQYVWSFNRFFDVAVATFIGASACGPFEPADQTSSDSTIKATVDPKPPEKAGTCCADFDFDFGQFVDLFQKGPDFHELMLKAPARAARDFLATLKSSFNFTDSMAAPWDLVQDKPDSAVAAFEKRTLAHGPLKRADK
jgi:hypothetical protein